MRDAEDRSRGLEDASQSTGTMNDDILQFIKSCIKERKTYWTYHVNMRLKGRTIPRESILDSVDTYEIIESYPKDKYMPSCLVYAMHKNEVFHIQIAADTSGDTARIVTAYKPTLDKWEEGFKKRRKE